jgi:hydrogenase maturation protein HypF
VQGVGFRPFIYGLARSLSITGTVANTQEGVHIYANCSPALLENFITGIRTGAPEQSVITSLEYSEFSEIDFMEFNIVESLTHGFPDLLITPDFATCSSCRKELLDATNRRYQYPYITCTSCGPRFSIESALPYDRHRTSMFKFAMCKRCEKEYRTPSDRRFYSQTNSCPDCRVTQWITDNNGVRLDLSQQETVDFICNDIINGSVVAVKGIGGFLLMCDATKKERIMELRQKKDRPAKPFALMLPNLEKIRENFDVSEEELNNLNSVAAPIVLLRLKHNSGFRHLAEHIAPGLDRLGVMLPYTPLFLLIMEKLKLPLLATSGNMRGEPITYQNEKAIELLGNLADHFLFNNRDIQVPQDDSVVKYSVKHHQKIIIRRSRGYAPGFIQDAVRPDFGKKVLAMGALLKSTFAIWQHGRCHISQFLGDTTALESQVSYEKSLHHFRSLLRFVPEVVLIDKHPAYFSSLAGKEMAHRLQIKTKAIQHHEAHFWAALGENNLLDDNDKILGVVLDGTGMGNDGAVWGGEFFIFDDGYVKRTNHLRYYPHILGDKMALEPRLSALVVVNAAGIALPDESDIFTEKELKLYRKVLQHASLKTSSMGRLFDAVSGILGLCYKNTYEGEAAMYLEKVAQDYCIKAYNYPDPYDVTLLENGSVDVFSTIRHVLKDRERGVDKGAIAARFHSTVVYIIEKIAELQNAMKIAFSGGVMQNGLLVDMIIEKLGAKYKLYFHKELSPNDECISYGQLVGYYASTQVAERKRKGVQSKSLI